MSREDLRAMLTELADDVSQAQLVGAAVAQAARIRRRRRAVVGAALAVVVVSAAGVALSRPTRTPAPLGLPSATALPSMAGSARVDRLPATIAADPDAAPYWPESAVPPANAPSLIDKPVSHAVMLYSSHPAEGQAPSVYVYGEGSIYGGSGNGSFHWARVPVDLSYTHDAGGNQALPLDQNSLGPMGRRAAFAQPDAVVIVNLMTGAAERIALPGLNEDVSWLINDRHVLVSSATQTWLVDTETRSAVAAAAIGTTVTPLVGEGSGLTTLTVAGSGAEPPVLRFYDDAGLAEQSHRTVNASSAAPYRIAFLSPRGWRYGNLVAQAASGQIGSTYGDFVAVIDDHTGDITHVLDLGGGRNKGCCSVVGWLNGTDVLVYTDQTGLLRWQLTTSIVTRLTDPAAGPISVAPTGCGFTITIAGVTSGCIA